jgi:small nuclear ribonucleoprotein (snRNP)-like protein
MSSAPKRESILELSKLMDSKVRVKCLGGRELEGILKGYDDLVNLVLDDCDEFLRGKSFPFLRRAYELYCTWTKTRTSHSYLERPGRQ